jgi:hypothetical protein
MIIAVMPLVETCSVPEAGAVLGLRPPSVRARIRARQLVGVRIGRSWRVTVASVNAMLATPAKAPAVPTSPPQANPTTTGSPDPVSPAPSPPPTLQANPSAPPFFEPDDMLIIHYCERVRFDCHPASQKLAAWILEKHRRFAHAVAIDRPPPEPITPRRFDLF